MENYKRTVKSVDSEQEQKPSADNEIRISHSKISVYVDIGLKKFQVKEKKKSSQVKMLYLHRLYRKNKRSILSW